MSSCKLKFSSASLISVRILQLLVSSLVAGFVPVILDKAAWLRLSCQCVCRDLMCTDTQLFAIGLELLMPRIEERVWILDILRCCTHLLLWSSIVMHCQVLPCMVYTDRNCVGLQLLQLLVIFDFVFCLEWAIRFYFCSWVPLCICRWIAVFWPPVFGWLCIFICSKIWCFVTPAAYLFWTCVVP